MVTTNQYIIMETIIIISIICITLIALAGCILSYFRIKSKQSATTISYIFWGSVVLSVSIAIYSHYYYDNENVLDFFSLASAIISIILAIITIVYSFYTNSRSNGQIEILNRAAQDVQRASQSYAESADSLETNIAKIISTINRVEAKTDRILIHSLSEGSTATNDINPNDTHNSFDIRKYIQTFVAISSPLGILAMYACILSHEKEMPFHISLLSSDADNTMYCAGFLIATTGTGIVNSTIDFSTGMITVINYVDVVKADIEEWIGSHPQQGSLHDLKEKIDAYFSPQK